MNKEYIDKINGEYDAFQYTYSNDYQKNISAFDEGKMWMELGFLIEEKNIFNRQAYVFLVFASELFIKSILIKNNIVFSNSHNLMKLFKKMDINIQKNIRNRVDIDELLLIDDSCDETGELKNFDEFLNYISNSFVDLRYDYEKIDKFGTIVPRKFINDLTFELYSICKKECEANE